MMDALVHTQDNAPDGTGYNDPPVNFREITEQQFAQSGFDGQSFTHVEFRQMILMEDLSPGKLKNGKMIQARLFWYSDETGVAISTDYWKGKVRYFAFGCNHSLTDPERNDSALDNPFKPKTYQAGKTYLCTKCKCNVKESWMQLITEDSGWKMNEFSSRPSRGIRDYDRTIKFSRKLDAKETLAVVKFLRKVDCPGWTGVGVKDRGDGTYAFNTTYDSSD